MIVEVLRNLKVEGGRIMNRGRYSDKDRPFPRQVKEELDSGNSKKVRFVRFEHHDKNAVPRETPPEEEPVASATDTLDRGEQDTLTASSDVESESVEEDQPKKKSSSRRKKSSSTKSSSRSKKSE